MFLFTNADKDQSKQHSIAPQNGWQKGEFVFSLKHWVETMDRYTLWSKVLLFCRRHLPDSQVEVLLQFSTWRKPVMLAQKARF